MFPGIILDFRVTRMAGAAADPDSKLIEAERRP